MVVHSLLTGGDNTWQDILFHNTPSYITSTIILSYKSNMKFNMIIFLHQSVSQGINGTHLQLLQEDQTLVEKLVKIPSYQSTTLSKPEETKETKILSNVTSLYQLTCLLTRSAHKSFNTLRKQIISQHNKWFQ